MTKSEENNEENLKDEKKTKDKKRANKKRKIVLTPDSPPTIFLQYMLTAIGFYDYIINRPFDMIFQAKALNQYNIEVINPLLENNDEFKQAHEQFKIDEITTNILSNAKKFAAEGGYSKSINELTRKYNLPIYIGSIAAMGAVIALSWTGLLVSGIEWYIMIPVVLVSCIAPTLINYLFQKKWLQFANDNIQGFIENNIDEINKGTEFVQQIINIAHSIMIENKLDGRRFRMMCFKNDYANLNIIEEKSQRGINYYVAEFVTPPFEDISDSKDNTQNDSSEDLDTKSEPDNNEDSS
ncbi:MAG: hypothetical protein ACTSWR_12265 [Candidatus Helarchaeota archaeon]